MKNIKNIIIGVVVISLLSIIGITHVFGAISKQASLELEKDQLVLEEQSNKDKYHSAAEIKAEYAGYCDLEKLKEQELKNLNTANANIRKQIRAVERKLGYLTKNL